MDGRTLQARGDEGQEDNGVESDRVACLKSELTAESRSEEHVNKSTVLSCLARPTLDVAERQTAEELEELKSFGEVNGKYTHATSSSTSSSPSPSGLFSNLSLSSSSPQLSLTPSLPTTVELDLMVGNKNLVLDVYRSGAAMMPALWERVPEQMRQVQYARLSSEDEVALEGALFVLPHLTQLRSLAIRGRHI